MFNRRITIRMIISGFVLMIIGFLFEFTFAKQIRELGSIALFAGLLLLVVNLVQNFFKKS